jgi:HK97 family phage major capsid protein
MLKQLMLRKKIELKRSELASLDVRREEIDRRSAEVEVSIAEANNDEEMETLESEAASIETDSAALEAEKSKLEGEIADIERELEDLRNNEPKPNTDPKPEDQNRSKPIEGETRMSKFKFFRNMSIESRDAIMAREEVKDFLVRVRELRGQQRAVTGAELEIPDVFLDMLRDNLHRYSKLISKVGLKPVKGKARQTITGSVPEGVWTEAVGALNELTLSFSQVEVDGYKVGGFVPIPNSTLEDSDLNLASEIMDLIGQAIGLGTDKAILFGTAIKMPCGIATRLAQTSQPSDWNTNAAPWTDLHTNNILKFDPSVMTSEAFFANLVAYLGVAKSNYSNGEKFWAMNEKTWLTIVAKTIAFNAAGALVATTNKVMPIVGGDIVILEFISDYDIIGGYGSLYLLAERAGAQLAMSEHVKFIEDQTVFKGTARYDGLPVFGEAFVAVNINNAAPTMSKSFTSDDANAVSTPYALPIAGAYTGTQVVNLYDLTQDATIYYTTNGDTPTAKSTRFTGPISVEATATIKAIAIKNGVSSEVFSATYTIS